MISIRDAAAADIAQVAAIYRDAVLHGTGSFELDPPDDAEMIARHRRIVGQGYPFLVACEGMAILGYAYAFAYRDRPAYRFTVEDSVYVRTECQGRGVGAALLARLIVEAETRGYRQMVAVIGDSANAGSVRLHRNAGFVPIGTLGAAGWKHDRWLDVVLMQRILGAGDTAPPAT
ncbi:GNAT family N-acetyltransferase [Beijerinckia sp. L45]|uniref:GNAT family N-acetyltransferase n=1 Tax=Beijerinckia sp. L45 TaxID=1641855 RepID=UPI00131C805E|nr:GNAT family N-acetyltransferase [Beijerinckia sp. L45]